MQTQDNKVIAVYSPYLLQDLVGNQYIPAGDQMINYVSSTQDGSYYLVCQSDTLMFLDR